MELGQQAGDEGERPEEEAGQEDEHPTKGIERLALAAADLTKQARGGGWWA